MENVNGMLIATTVAGTYSVASSQSMSRRLRAIMQATNSSAGAVAKAGIAVAIGANSRVNRNSTATVTAVSPVRPPAWMPAALSM
jgi:hypothetical protein